VSRPSASQTKQSYVRQAKVGTSRARRFFSSPSAHQPTPADVCHYHRPLSVKARPIQGLDLSKHHVPAIAQTFSTARCALACLAPNCAVLHLNVRQLNTTTLPTPRRAYPKARVTGFALNGVSPPHSFLICATTITTSISRFSRRHSDSAYSDWVFSSSLASHRSCSPSDWACPTSDPEGDVVRPPSLQTESDPFEPQIALLYSRLIAKVESSAYRTIFHIPGPLLVDRAHWTNNDVRRARLPSPPPVWFVEELAAELRSLD
jgi:hypothetical protein